MFDMDALMTALENVSEDKMMDAFAETCVEVLGKDTLTRLLMETMQEMLEDHLE